jgi:methylated-DNA-[protein]-cysteine S-methyltransferase
MKPEIPQEFEFFGFIFKDERGFHGGVASRRGLCSSSFSEKNASTVKRNLKESLGKREGKLKWVKELNEVSNEDARYILARFQSELDEYFHGKLKRFTLPIEIGSGSDFERKVWMNLERIPYGETVSFSFIADKIGDSKAARNIGSACGNNPLPVIIPCHRVLAPKNKLTGCPGGITRQKMLLKLEGSLPEAKR